MNPSFSCAASNTPARRKFLRTDKTEFAHIDEVIRRIALAKFNIAFTLTHLMAKLFDNIVLQRMKNNSSNVLPPFVAMILMQHALRIDWKHDDLHLSGWVATPEFTRSQNDLSYCYINGRMVRDKVITTPFAKLIQNIYILRQYPVFVLFIDLNPHDVDVNVHPTKHEVRFHQARLIHDFICQGVTNALNTIPQAELDLAPAINEGRRSLRLHINLTMNRNPIRRQRDHNIFASNHHQPRENNQKIDRTFQTIVNTFPSYGYRKQPTKTEPTIIWGIRYVLWKILKF